MGEWFKENEFRKFSLQTLGIDAGKSYLILIVTHNKLENKYVQEEVH